MKAPKAPIESCVVARREDICAGWLRITAAKEIALYHYERLECSWCRSAWRLRKGIGKNARKTEYSVQIAINGDVNTHSCECWAFYRHNVCRHVTAILARESEL
jgi:hypothetical protein